MGALPSRESNEDPSSLVTCDCGSHVAFDLPLTPHYFPFPDGLAFRQLFHARNHRSAVYAFHLRDVGAYLPAGLAEAYRRARAEDWGLEAAEVDPGLHDYDGPEGEGEGEGEEEGEGAPARPRNPPPAIEDPAALYDALVRAPTADGGLVQTNAELRERLAQERRWEEEGGPAPPRFLYPLAKAILVQLPPAAETDDDVGEKEKGGLARRRYRFESCAAYRDGRVHLVEEDGALYCFAVNPHDGEGGGGARPAAVNSPASEGGEFRIPITRVRVVGVHGPLPARARGTPWLRGTDDDPAEDARREGLPSPPPVLRLCRFIEGAVGEKILNRVALASLCTYRGVCLRAGLSESLVRPMWSLFTMSNIPSLQLVRETYFLARAAVAEVEHHDLRLRQHLETIDRENNFRNFLNMCWGEQEGRPERPRTGAEVDRARSDANDRGGVHENTPLPDSRRRESRAETEEIDQEVQKEEKRDPNNYCTQRSRPSFTRDFSSRLEPCAPYVLESLYESGAAENLVLPPPGSGKLPSYVLEDALAKCEMALHRRGSIAHREHESTPHPTGCKGAKPHWVALYNCGIMETIRGRFLLVRIRQDALSALLYYLSLAAVPMFVGEYMEPSDATNLTYCGSIRLSRAAREKPDEWDTLEQFDIDLAVLAEHTAHGLIPVFSVSDPSAHAVGPSADHRLKRMVLQALPDPTSPLALRQRHEREHDKHVKSYAAGDFRDGDLIVYNCQTFMWEHYEHVRLRMQFERLGLACSPTTTVKRAEKGTCAQVEVASIDPGMEARLLCVSLDVLLLSWCKWVKDNRLFEERDNSGWLRTTETPTGLLQVGRYCIWSFRLNRERFFLGVIPKFVKNRLRRKQHANKKKNKNGRKPITNGQCEGNHKAREQSPQDELTEPLQMSHHSCPRLVSPNTAEEDPLSEIPATETTSGARGTDGGGVKPPEDPILCGTEDNDASHMVTSPMSKIKYQREFTPDSTTRHPPQTGAAVVNACQQYSQNRCPAEGLATSVRMDTGGACLSDETTNLRTSHGRRTLQTPSLFSRLAPSVCEIAEGSLKSELHETCTSVGAPPRAAETPSDYQTSASRSPSTLACSRTATLPTGMTEPSSPASARPGACHHDAGNTSIQVNKRMENRYFPFESRPPIPSLGPTSSETPLAWRGRRCYRMHNYHHKQMRGHISPVPLADAVAVSGLHVQVRVRQRPSPSPLSSSLASSLVVDAAEWLGAGGERARPEPDPEAAHFLS